MNAIIETVPTKILARFIVIHLLYFVGRETAMKQSIVKAKTIPKEILRVSNDNEDPTLASFSKGFRPKNKLYSTAAKIGSTIAPVNTFAVDIVSRNKDDGVRKLLRGSTQPVKTKRPLPNTVNGDKIILYRATISSSVSAADLEVSRNSPVKLEVFMNENIRCASWMVINGYEISQTHLRDFSLLFHHNLKANKAGVIAKL